VPLGIIHPCGNLAYFHYSHQDWLDESLYVVYRPCLKLFPPEATHLRDRVYPRFEDLGE